MVDWRIMALAIAFNGAALGEATNCMAAEPPVATPGAMREAERLNNLPPLPPQKAGHINQSGRTEKGGASYYASRFANRKMADGRRMNPNANVAASKTLPLGSVAKVTNLSNGKTATVTIQDRGPYVNGRVVDLAPKVAQELDVTQKGVVPVEVKPVTLPQPDGGVKLGAGAADSSPREVQHAVAVTKALTETKPAETAEK
jgi:rare lipoprotein A